MPTGDKNPLIRRFRRHAPRGLRRWLVILTVLATWWLTSVPAAATGHPASVSWPGIWNWLTRHHPSLSLPVQQRGTAKGRPHQVPAIATRAGRGSGGPAGKGRGEL